MKRCRAHGPERLARIVIAALVMAACGSPTAEPGRESARSAGAEVAPSATGAPMPAEVDEAAPVAPLLGRVIGATPLEPQLLTPVVLVPRPAQPLPIRLALASLHEGQSFRPPAGACQDVLLFVRAGELRAVGTGIAPTEAPATLYAGDAVRFGPEGDGLVQNLGAQTARTVIAFVRSEGEPSFEDPGPSGGEGCRAADPRDPRIAPIRAASEWSTPAYEAYEGALRVRILLDEDGAGARVGSLAILDGDPSLTIPQHRHEGASEILIVEEGAGTMRVGDRDVAVRAGTAIYVPPGELHDFRGDGTRPLRAIEVHTPAGPEQALRQ